MPSTFPVQTQGNFAAGQWDTVSQGRFDHPWYKFMLAASLNGLPTESGAWVKRSGTQWLGPTYKRLPGYVLPFYGNSSHRYAVVLTTDGSTGWAHFWSEDAVLTDGTTANIGNSSSSGGVLTLTVDVTPGSWVVGDQFVLTSVPTSGGPYLNRWLYLNAVSGTTLTFLDDTGSVFTFDTGSGALAGAVLNKIARFTTGFLGNLNKAQIVNIGVQSYGGPIEGLLLCPGYAPQLISLTIGNTATITVAAATFTDGPYRDPQGFPGTLETGTVSGYSGTITFTPQTTTFSATDVGRSIRLLTQPAAWSSSTVYTTGNQVTYNGSWWQWVGSSAYAGLTNVVPGTLYTTTGGVQVLLWAPVPTAGQWAWGTIATQSGTSCTITLTTNLNSANGTTVFSWRLGVFTNTAGAWPTCGGLHQGRLWLGGALQGRLDGSNSSAFLTFSPTDIYGNVFDNHSLGLQLATETQDNIQWFKPDRSGLMIGTLAQEHTLSGGGNDTPITPRNFSLDKKSQYGSLGPQGTCSAGFSTIFAQTGGKILYEYVADAFTTAPSGRVLNEFSRGLVSLLYGISEVAYTETRVPVIWVMTGDGLLLSCTYRRASRFMSSPPDQAGWARHQLCDLHRLVNSLTVLQYPDQTWDFLYLTTTTTGAVGGAVGIANGVELMQPIEPGL